MPACLVPLNLTTYQEAILRLIRKNPGSRGLHLIQETNFVLGRDEPRKKLSTGWSALARLNNRSLIRLERHKSVGSGPYAIRYWITAEGRTALDRIDKRKDQ